MVFGCILKNFPDRDRAINRDLDPVQSREGEIAINGDWNVCRRDRDRHELEIVKARAHSLSLSHSLSHFPEIL